MSTEKEKKKDSITIVEEGSTVLSLKHIRSKVNVAREKNLERQLLPNWFLYLLHDWWMFLQLL